jgi:hypothetical protein
MNWNIKRMIAMQPCEEGIATYRLATLVQPSP